MIWTYLRDSDAYTVVPELQGGSETLRGLVKTQFLIRWVWGFVRGLTIGIWNKFLGCTEAASPRTPPLENHCLRRSCDSFLSTVMGLFNGLVIGFLVPTNNENIFVCDRKSFPNESVWIYWGSVSRLVRCIQRCVAHGRNLEAELLHL